LTEKRTTQKAFFLFTVADGIYENYVVTTGTVIRKHELCQSYAQKLSNNMEKFREEFKVSICKAEIWHKCK